MAKGVAFDYPLQVMKSPYAGLQRLFAAMRYSWQGLRTTYVHEAAFRQELWLLAAMVPLALWLARSPGDFLLLLGVWLLVLVVELLNSAVETVVDRIDPDYHPLAGRAKDQASAAVMVSLLLAAGVWGWKIWEKLT